MNDLNLARKLADLVSGVVSCIVYPAGIKLGNDLLAGLKDVVVEELSVVLLKLKLVVVVAENHAVLLKNVSNLVEACYGLIPLCAAGKLCLLVPGNNAVLNAEGLKELCLLIGVLVVEAKTLVNRHTLEAVLVKDSLDLFCGVVKIACELNVLIAHIGDSLKSALKICLHRLSYAVKLNTNLKFFHYYILLSFKSGPRERAA